MKKLSKASLDSMAKMLPELDERDQRSILGGTSTGAYPEGYTGSVAVPITGYTDADPYGVTGEYMSSDFQPTGEYATGAVTGDYTTGIYSEEEIGWDLNKLVTCEIIYEVGTRKHTLDTPFEKECLKNYLVGYGISMELDEKRFEDIAKAEQSRRSPVSLDYDFSNEEMVLIDGEMYIKRNVSFYNANQDGSPNQYDYALGTATMYFDTETDEAVGLYDRYDFNKETKGVRKKEDEFATLIGRIVGDIVGAKSYDIHYGKHE